MIIYNNANEAFFNKLDLTKTDLNKYTFKLETFDNNTFSTTESAISKLH